jgi:hypothetical protein
VDNDDHLSAGFIGLHDAMRFADLLEAKQLGGSSQMPLRRRLRSASIDKGPAPPRISTTRQAMYSRLIS